METETVKFVAKNDDKIFEHEVWHDPINSRFARQYMIVSYIR